MLALFTHNIQVSITSDEINVSISEDGTNYADINGGDQEDEQNNTAIALELKLPVRALAGIRHSLNSGQDENDWLLFLAVFICLLFFIFCRSCCKKK